MPYKDPIKQKEAQARYFQYLAHLDWFNPHMPVTQFPERS